MMNVKCYLSNTRLYFCSDDIFFFLYGIFDIYGKICVYGNIILFPMARASTPPFLNGNSKNVLYVVSGLPTTRGRSDCGDTAVVRWGTCTGVYSYVNNLRTYYILLNIIHYMYTYVTYCII